MLHPMEDASVNPALIPRLATFKNGFGSDWELGSLPVAEDGCYEQRSRGNLIRGKPGASLRSDEEWHDHRATRGRRPS